MSERDLETVRRLVEPWAGGVNIPETLADAELIETIRELIDDDAVVEFATPEGGFVGGMAGPFRGADGYLAGWREWAAPWSDLRAAIEGMHDLGDGRVLIEVELTARLGESSAPVVQAAAALYELGAGLVMRIEHFLDREQARRAAGLG